MKYAFSMAKITAEHALSKTMNLKTQNVRIWDSPSSWNALASILLKMRKKETLVYLIFVSFILREHSFDGPS